MISSSPIIPERNPEPGVGGRVSAARSRPFDHPPQMRGPSLNDTRLRMDTKLDTCIRRQVEIWRDPYRVEHLLPQVDGKGGNSGLLHGSRRVIWSKLDELALDHTRNATIVNVDCFINDEV